VARVEHRGEKNDYVAIYTSWGGVNAGSVHKLSPNGNTLVMNLMVESMQGKVKNPEDPLPPVTLMRVNPPQMERWELDAGSVKRVVFMDYDEFCKEFFLDLI
jgi:hypothetical protein